MFSHTKESESREGRYLMEAGLLPEMLTGKRILNVGAGETDLEHYLQSCCGVECWVVNADLEYNPSLRSIFWNLLGKMHRDDFPARSVQADIRNLPMQDNAFDIAFARNIIPFFLTYKGEAQALIELARVTRGPIYVYPSSDATLLAARRLGLGFSPIRNNYGTLVIRSNWVL